ncbi:signal transduction histidine kinase [Saccharothrix carnea]|uniref:histidine kinase n=1 Tax=Saccharothrix carnea TaxID=1280637 RepID=A0A2P8IBW8_SACCR|nr:sensor histidine kinase [Saccharothrix carnea]PSL55955.1 signal transduction histidine kinase [Saccharothrix carnea]
MAGLRGRTADIALALAAGLVALLGLLVQARGIDTPAEWAALAAVLVSSAALYVRRRHPIPVGVVALAAVAAYGALLQQPGPIMVVFVVALYTVVDEGHLAVAIGLGLASVLAFAFADSFTKANNGATFLHAGWLVAVIVGVTRNRRAYLAEARARALAAEQRMEEEARRRATEERLRIARELHDALGHHLSLINVQASAALHRPDPERTEQALTAIKQTSKETLRELRTTLTALRQDGGVPPGLNRLDDLITTAGRTGLEIRVELAETRPLPPEVDLAAFRIVQEALTNVTRHAAATAAVVRVRPDDDAVLVEVEDDGDGAPGTPGNGILGMRERAQALGGSLTAGPRPDGGFRVHARLPLRADRVPA